MIISRFEKNTLAFNKLMVLPGATNATTEWWTEPIATYLPTPTPRTVYGAIASNGDILACELIHSTGVTTRYVVGSAIPDDHCCPALYAVSGRRMVIAWTNHNQDNLIHLRVGGTGNDISVWGTETTIDLGSLASYTQIHRIASMSDTSQDTYILLSRYNSTFWGMLTFSVNVVTGALNVTRNFRTIVDGNSNQLYLSTADAYNYSGNQTLRVCTVFNPSMTTHELHYFEIDLVTGAVSSTLTPSLSNNIYTGTAISLSTLTPLVANVPGQSRRMFYVRSGPMPPAVAFADWDTSTPDAATYKVIRYTGSSWVTESFGIAGQRVGYVDTSNYLAGMAFPNPCTEDVIFIARRHTNNQVSHVENWFRPTGQPDYTKVTIAFSANKLARPYSPVNAVGIPLIFNDFLSYGASTYTDYAGSLKLCSKE